LADCLERLRCSGLWAVRQTRSSLEATIHVQWKPLIMISLGLALFDNNNLLITLSGGYKNVHYLTQVIVTVQLASRKACFDSRATCGTII